MLLIINKEMEREVLTQVSSLVTGSEQESFNEDTVTCLNRNLDIHAPFYQEKIEIFLSYCTILTFLLQVMEIQPPKA